MESLFVGVGDNPPLTPPRRGRQEKRGMSEEVGAKFCPKIVLPNYAPKIRSMHEREELKQAHFLKAPKRHLSLYVNAFRFNQQVLIRYSKAALIFLCKPGFFLLTRRYIIYSRIVHLD